MIGFPVVLAALSTLLLWDGADARPGEGVHPVVCSKSVASVRRIESWLGVMWFYVPTGLAVRRFSDVDYVGYRVRYGGRHNPEWMNFMFGGNVGGGEPSSLSDSYIEWRTREWECSATVRGREWLGVGRDGRRSRYMTLPFGFAAYRSVSLKAAVEFDKVLDGACCSETKRMVNGGAKR